MAYEGFPKKLRTFNLPLVIANTTLPPQELLVGCWSVCALNKGADENVRFVFGSLGELNRFANFTGALM
jgi:hypothetical protein